MGIGAYNDYEKEVFIKGFPASFKGSAFKTFDKQ